MIYYEILQHSFSILSQYSSKVADVRGLTPSIQLIKQHLCKKSFENTRANSETEELIRNRLNHQGWGLVGGVRGRRRGGKIFFACIDCIIIRRKASMVATKNIQHTEHSTSQSHSLFNQAYIKDTPHMEILASNY